MTKIARDTAVKARTSSIMPLNATLVTATEELRGELEPLSDHKLITACAALESAPKLDDPEAAMPYPGRTTMSSG